MEEHCRKCGTKLKEDAKFCPNCGENVPSSKINPKYFIIAIIIVIIAAVLVTTALNSQETQTVSVDNVQFEIPADYVNEPARTEVSYDDNVKSSSMGWSNDEKYIEIGITRSPGSGIDSDKIAASIGGTPKKMYGYTGYYNDYGNQGQSFVFGMKDKVCMIYVSDYDAFSDVKVLSE